MNKIKEISTKQNRTILFVSHNLNTIKYTTNKCIILDKGQLISQGSPTEIIDEYLISTTKQ